MYSTANNSPPYDAVVLAGGRASRLNGISKPFLVFNGKTLLSQALSAVATAHRVVIVGEIPAPIIGEFHGDPRITTCCETPQFSGPVAALAAGITALDAEFPHSTTNPYLAVLAADLPQSAAAIPVLLAEIYSTPSPATAAGVIAVDSSGTPQYLLGVYHRQLLTKALRSADPIGRSMRSLVAELSLATLQLPDLWCADVDTPGDAAKLGIPLTNNLNY